MLFVVGTLSLQSPLPPFIASPAAYREVIPESEITFGGGSINSMREDMKTGFVQASGAITQYDSVWVTPAGQASPITAALAATGGRPGFAQTAFASFSTLSGYPSSASLVL